MEITLNVSHNGVLYIDAVLKSVPQCHGSVCELGCGDLWCYKHYNIIKSFDLLHL